MGGSIIVGRDAIFSLGSVGFDAILENTRDKFRPAEAQYAKDIYAGYDGGMPFIALDDKGPEHLNAFYRATFAAYSAWVTSSANANDPWKFALTPYWERLLDLLRSDPRWRNEEPREPGSR